MAGERRSAGSAGNCMSGGIVRSGGDGRIIRPVPCGNSASLRMPTKHGAGGRRELARCFIYT